MLILIIYQYEILAVATCFTKGIINSIATILMEISLHFISGVGVEVITTLLLVRPIHIPCIHRYLRG